MSWVVETAYVGAALFSGLAVISLLSARRPMEADPLHTRAMAIGVGLVPLWLGLVVLAAFILALRSDGTMSLAEMVLSFAAFATVLVSGYLVWGALVRRGGVLARLEGVAKRVRAANLGDA